MHAVCVRVFVWYACWLLSLLKSSAISLTAKSIWNGAICSRRMSRCLMRNNCPSNGVYSTTQQHRGIQIWRHTQGGAKKISPILSNYQ